MAQPASHPEAGAPVVGAGQFRFQVQPDWAQLPVGWSFVEVSGVAVDSEDNLYAFNRGEHPVIVFNRSGQFLHSWGEGEFPRPHGIFIGPDDAIYCVDDLDHTVRKYSREGKLLLSLGRSGQWAETGATTVDYRTIQHAAGPFNFPTNMALGSQGDLFVADGYGNARVHHFSPDGTLLHSWGRPGAGPGEFHVPHGIAVTSDDTVIVADRENSRLQFFRPDGTFVDQWTNIARPCQITLDGDGNVLVAELGYRAGMFPGDVPPEGATTGGRLSVFNPQGELQARWGGGDNPCAAGDFYAPHDLCLDSRGDLYVSEVVWSAGGRRGLVSPDCHTLQKFVRLPTQD